VYYIDIWCIIQIFGVLYRFVLAGPWSPEADRSDQSCFLTDIDECLEGPCADTAECDNRPGSFGCTCRGGYNGAGFTASGCQNDNECK